MLRDNMGNILKVVHETGCDITTAAKALANTDSWSDAFKFARAEMEKLKSDE